MSEEDTIFFDSLGKYYDSKFLNLGHIGARMTHETHLALVISQLTCLGGSKIVDVGCGTGALFQSLQEKAYDIYGVDLSRVLLKLAKRKFRKVSLIRASALLLPFQNTFSAAILFDTLHHLPDAKKCMREVWNILLPNGFLIIFEPNRTNLLAEFLRAFLKRVGLLSPRESAVDIQQIIRDLQDSGFAIMKIAYFNVLSLPLSGMVTGHAILPSSRVLFNKLLLVDRMISNSVVSRLLTWKVLIVAKKEGQIRKLEEHS